MIRQLAIAGASLLVAVLSGQDAARAYWLREASAAYDHARPPQGLPARFAGDPAFRVIATQTAVGYQLAPVARLAAIDADARAALRREPLNPPALFQLGLVAEARRGGSGLGFFRLAEQISRRDPVNEVGLGRLAVASGDNAGAIARIDRAVSVAPALAAEIFPPLVPALADPAIRRAFVARAARPWYPDLIAAAIDHGGDPAMVSAMLGAAGPEQPPAQIENLHFQVMSKAIAAGRFDAVRGIVATMPAGPRAAVAHIGFAEATSDRRLLPLGWALVNDGPVSAHITGGDSLTVTIAAEHSAVAAERWTLLAPGIYQVASTLAFDARAPRAGVEWEVLCASAAQPSLARRPLQSGGGVRRTDRWVLPVPAGCGAQIWRIKAFGDSGPGPSVVTIGNLAVIGQ